MTALTPHKSYYLDMIDDFLKDISTLAIFGHVRPDGDCVGSTLALYNYITDNFPNIKVKVYLEKFPESYKYSIKYPGGSPVILYEKNYTEVEVTSTYTYLDSHPQ